MCIRRMDCDMINDERRLTGIYPVTSSAQRHSSSPELRRRPVCVEMIRGTRRDQSAMASTAYRLTERIGIERVCVVRR